MPLHMSGPLCSKAASQTDSRHRKPVMWSLLVSYLVHIIKLSCIMLSGKHKSIAPSIVSHYDVGYQVLVCQHAGTGGFHPGRLQHILLFSVVVLPSTMSGWPQNAAWFRYITVHILENTPAACGKDKIRWFFWKFNDIPLKLSYSMHYHYYYLPCYITDCTILIDT